MMPTAILITFEYNFQPLPGAIIDLYHAYTWCKSFDCDIHVLTDITSIRNRNNLHQAIQKRIVDSNILSFYDEIESKNIITTLDSMIQALTLILTHYPPEQKLIIYYSGHGIKDSMVIPDKSILSFINFRDLILDKLNPYIEIFWILDCCNPNGLHLPYKLDNDIFVLSDSKIEFVTQPILLITSSNKEETSIGTKYGSVFSRYLFESLSKKSLLSKNRNLTRWIRHLERLIQKKHIKLKTGRCQTVSIYSSYIYDPILWMWIGFKDAADIAIDMSLSVLNIRSSRPYYNPYKEIYGY